MSQGYRRGRDAARQQRARCGRAIFEAGDGQRSGGECGGDPAAPGGVESAATSLAAEALRLAAVTPGLKAFAAPQASCCCRMLSHRRSPVAASAPMAAPGPARPACVDRSAARRSTSRSSPCSLLARPGVAMRRHKTGRRGSGRRHPQIAASAAAARRRAADRALYIKGWDQHLHFRKAAEILATQARMSEDCLARNSLSGAFGWHEGSRVWCDCRRPTPR